MLSPLCFDVNARTCGSQAPLGFRCTSAIVTPSASKLFPPLSERLHNDPYEIFRHICCIGERISAIGSRLGLIRAGAVRDHSFRMTRHESWGTNREKLMLPMRILSRLVQQDGSIGSQILGRLL